MPVYSVLFFVGWNNDKLNDLVVGKGESFGEAKVRVYLNVEKRHTLYLDQLRLCHYG